MGNKQASLYPSYEQNLIHKMWLITKEYNDLLQATPESYEKRKNMHKLRYSYSFAKANFARQLYRVRESSRKLAVNMKRTGSLKDILEIKEILNEKSKNPKINVPKINNIIIQREFIKYLSSYDCSFKKFLDAKSDIDSTFGKNNEETLSIHSDDLPMEDEKFLTFREFAMRNQLISDEDEVTVSESKNSEVNNAMSANTLKLKEHLTSEPKVKGLTCKSAICETSGISSFTTSDIDLNDEDVIKEIHNISLRSNVLYSNDVKSSQTSENKKLTDASNANEIDFIKALMAKSNMCNHDIEKNKLLLVEFGKCYDEKSNLMEKKQIELISEIFQYVTE